MRRIGHSLSSAIVLLLLVPANEASKVWAQAEAGSATDDAPNGSVFRIRIEKNNGVTSAEKGAKDRAELEYRGRLSEREAARPADDKAFENLARLVDEYEQARIKRSFGQRPDLHSLRMTSATLRAEQERVDQDVREYVEIIEKSEAFLRAYAQSEYTPHVTSFLAKSIGKLAECGGGRFQPEIDRIYGELEKRPDLSSSAALSILMYRANQIELVAGTDRPTTASLTAFLERLDDFLLHYPQSMEIDSAYWLAASILQKVDGDRATTYRKQQQALQTARMNQRLQENAINRQKQDEADRKLNPSVHVKADPEQAGILGSRPTLVLEMLDGRLIDLEKLRGKVVLIDFWSVGLAQSQKAIPELREAYAKYKEQGFEIIGIGMELHYQFIEDFAKSHDMRWPQFCDGQGIDNAVVRAFGLRQFPARWLIDKTGKVVDLNPCPGLEQKIEDLLHDREIKTAPVETPRTAPPPMADPYHVTTAPQPFPG